MFANLYDEARLSRAEKELHLLPASFSLGVVLKVNTMRKRKYPQWFIDELANEEDKQKARNNELKISDRVDFVCPYHGIYNQEIRVHIKKSTGEKIGGCRACSQNYKRHYEQWFIDMLAHEEDKEKARHNALQSIDKVDLICPIHGVFNTTVGYITCNGKKTTHGCPQCGKERQLKKYSETMQENRPEYPQWFIDDIAKEEDKERARKREITKRDEILFHCAKHGDYLQIVTNHLKKGIKEGKGGCKKCAVELMKNTIKEVSLRKRKEYPEWFINDLAHKEDKQRARDRVLSSKDTVEFVCPIHGNYLQSVNNHFVFSTQRGRCGCPICAYRKSRPEDELFEIIKNLDNDAKQRDRSILKNKKTGHYLEIDVLSNNHKLAFEFNGNFWHSKHHREINYHFFKYEECINKGLRLFTIFQKDWDTDKEKTINYIKQLFTKKLRISARKTELKRIDNITVSDFYSEYYLNNTTMQYDISYGLFLNNELISAMSFSRSKNKDEWLLQKYCVKFGVTILGGANKLIKHFKKETNPVSITAHSDCCYFNGNIFDKLGFIFKGYSKNDYYWFYNGEYIEKDECVETILKKKYPELYALAIKEKEIPIEDFIMRKLKFYKIERIGLKIWKLDVESNR